MSKSKRTLGLALLVLLYLMSLSCSGGVRVKDQDAGGGDVIAETPIPDPGPTVEPVTKTPVPQREPTISRREPTMEDCRHWLTSSEELTVPIACPDWSFFRAELFKRGGGVFPVGEGRYYLAWFPDNWDTITDRKVIISLHGTGGCAEWALNQWYQATSHTWALVAMQYYDPESGHYDDDRVIYENLQSVLDDLKAHCPVAGSDVFYHGFSRGSAQSLPVAIRDRADRQIFSAFIADSGCSGPGYPTLQNQPADALAGARFWMWCGENDVSTVDPSRMTCEVMDEDMRTYIEAHGGQVDALIREEGGWHGMFNDCDAEGHNCVTRKAENLGPSLPVLFEYIESFPQ